MMLAQSIDALPADTLKNFLWAAAALMVVAYYAKQLFWGNKNPQPFAVEGTPPDNKEIARDLKAMNHRLVALEQWRGQLLSKLDADKGEVIEAGEERARRIYTHVEDVRKEIDSKITRLPNELVALLKNTGAIK
jgi:hypothetical protein